MLCPHSSRTPPSQTPFTLGKASLYLFTNLYSLHRPILLDTLTLPAERYYPPRSPSGLFSTITRDRVLLVCRVITTRRPVCWTVRFQSIYGNRRFGGIVGLAKHRALNIRAQHDTLIAIPAIGRRVVQ